MKYTEWLLVVLLLLCTTPTIASSKEEVLLHDGRSIEIDREVFETGLGLCFLCTAPRPPPSSNKHKLRFLSPDTKTAIEWEGEANFYPMLLDFIDEVPYLVVQGRPTQESAKRYGCPELPFIYLRYESGFWYPIPVEKAPLNLKNANLSRDIGNNNERRSHEDVKRNISEVQRRSGNYIQTRIPRTYDEWDYVGKIEERDTRRIGDCRPARQPRTPNIPKPIDVTLEKLQSFDLPESEAQEYFGAAWKNIAIKEENCRKFFALVDPNDKLLGERFVLDHTEKKLLPYPGSAPIRNLDFSQKRTYRYCDDEHIWFVAPFEEKGKIHLAKYSTSGDFIYNVRISDQGTWRYDTYNEMRYGLMSSDEGYLSFYWAQSLITQDSRKAIYNERPVSEWNTRLAAVPMRIVKYRFQEPIQRATESMNQ